MRLRPGSKVLPRFLRLFLDSPSYWSQISQATNGIALPNINGSKLAAVTMPLPPIAEQRNIVEILEDHLSRLDAATDLMMSATRRSIVLRDARLRRLFDLPGVVESTLGSVAQWGSGGTPRARTPSFYVGGTIPWVVSGDLKDTALSSVTGRITEAGMSASSAKWVEPGSVLIAMYGATIGRLAISTERVTTNQAVAYAKPDSSQTTSEYLFWYLRSQRAGLVAAGQGGAQPNISQTILKRWPVPLPSFDVQSRVVLAAKQVFEEAAALSDAAALARERSSALRTTLLRAAFDGSLVARDAVAHVEETHV
jgi:hypothetical protein